MKICKDNKWVFSSMNIFLKVEEKKNTIHMFVNKK